MVECHHPVIRRYTVRVDLVPPLPFPKNRSGLRQGERGEFSPIDLTLPEEVRSRFFFFFFYLNILKYTHICTISIPSNWWSVGGFAEQPQLDQDDKAPSQPKPHPSGKIE